MAVSEFTKDEVVALKEMAEEHIQHNLRTNGTKIKPGPNKFPKGYKGPRTFAEAMARKLDPVNKKMVKRK